MPYALQAFDEKFFSDAPLTYLIDVDIPVSPEAAWGEFTRQEALDWCKALRSVRFTSPEPYAPGTTRSVALAGGLKMTENFFLWEEDPASSTYRHAFHGVEVNVPGLRAFGEYTEVSPTANGTRLIWKFAMDFAGLRLPGFLSGPIANGAFSSVRNDTIKHFATFGR